MRFDLDHDWQGNISTPRARVGENAKTNLLILLCAIWLIIGLTGHNPWKPFESNAISIIKSMIDTGHILAPVAASSPHLVNPPLYYLSAVATSKLLGFMLPMHDAARVCTGLWMLITLLMVGMSGRELWGKGYGRQTTLVFIGCLGLVLNAHTLTPEVSALAGAAMALYGLALSNRRPYRASMLLGVAMSIGFLSTGFLPLSFICLTCLLLPIGFRAWRTARYFKTLLLALLIASPFLLIWPILCAYYYPALFSGWWLGFFNNANHSDHLYFINTLLWYGWPALPLAIWTVWRYRKQLLTNPKFQLCLTFFVTSLLMIGASADHKEIYALPLLLPLTLLAGTGIETLKRGAAGALNWFGLILFGIMSGLIWCGWVAMLTGSPAKLKERMVFLSGLTQINLQVIPFAIAALMTLIWLFAVFRARHTNRSSATNWAIGMTCVWTLLMTLWLPLIDSARNYGDVFTSLKSALPAHYACLTSRNVNGAQLDLLNYYTDIEPQIFEKTQRIDCNLYLIQDERNAKKIMPGAQWRLIWSGKRISERQESFRLLIRE